MKGKVVELSTGLAKGHGVDPTLKTDVAANDSTKDFTVPAGKIWHILHAFVTLVTTATVGNRLVTLSVYKADGTTCVARFRSVAQAASLTKEYMYAPGLNTAEFATIQNALPDDMPIPAGYIVRIADDSAVDAAADDLSIQMFVDESDVTSKRAS